MGQAVKRIFFLSSAVIPKKDAGGGSVIIYRHLERLKQEGFEVTVVIFGAGEDYYDQFQYNFFPKKRWYPFLRKKTPLLTDITTTLYYKALTRKINFNPATDITLGVLCEISNLVLVNLFKKNKIPYFLFYHDDSIFNRYWNNIALVERHISCILLKANHIFCVSAQMVEFLKGRNVQNASVLYPIPEVYKGRHKQYEGTLNKTLNFCYAGLAMHIHYDIMNRIGKAVGAIGGKFYCVTGQLAGFEPDDPGAMIVKNRFETVAGLQQFIVQDIDVVIVFYSFDLQHEPRMESSFPSKFVEYAQLNIPVLLVAPAYSSLGKWAVANGWLSYVDSDDPAVLRQMLSKFRERDYWLACQAQAIRVAADEFNPGNIHQKLTHYLNIGMQASYDRSL